MKTYFIGDMIKRRRKELKWTQEQLCEGICEPVTISRLENGKQTPSANTLRVLLQRLGMPEYNCFALVDKDDMLINDIITEVISCNTLRDKKRGFKALAELEKLADPNDPLMRQLILRSKALLGKSEDEPYTNEEKLELLLEAIHITVPHFDENAIYKGIFSIDEAKVINQIAGVYSYLGEHKKAVDIYYQLLQYIERRFANILRSSGILPLVAFNYARELVLVGRYTEAIEIAEMGWQACTQYGQYNTLAVTIAIIAECHHFLGDDEKSKAYYKQAYHVCEAVKDKGGVEAIKADIQKYFGDDFTF